jgi:hypothetical protein
VAGDVAPAQWTSIPEPELQTFGPLDGGQKPFMRLRPKFQLYSYRQDTNPDTPVQKFLLVTFDGSAVSPVQPNADLAWDTPGHRGYYTDTLTLTMSFPDTPAIVIRQDQPESSQEAGSVSNSISYTLTGGVFGTAGTGTGSVTIGNSISQTFPDFEVTKTSDDHQVLHRYQLKSTEVGTYTIPPDIVERRGESGYVGSPPTRARSDFPIISQALFHAPNGLSVAATLNVRFDYLLMAVDVTALPRPTGWVLDNTALKKARYDPSQRATLEKQVHVKDGLIIGVHCQAISHSWNFPVDFSAVG